MPRALLPVGGASIARHQLAQALAMECQRVICLAREFSPGIIELQHQAEQAGAQFHVISGPRQLSVLITAADDVLVLSDGLLTMPGALGELLSPAPCVLAQPIESGLAAGFERIDLNHATAGAIRIPGRLVENLGELPPDCDVASALTRIALQAGIRQVQVPAALRDGGGWRLIHDETEAHEAEHTWIRLHLGERRAASPGRVLARLTVRKLGPALLHARGGTRMVTLGAGFLLALGLLAGWFAHPLPGFALLGLAWFLRNAGGLLARIQLDSMQQASSIVHRVTAFGWLVDAAMVAVAVWARPAAEIGGAPWYDAAFAPLALIAMLRVTGEWIGPRAGAWLQDRLLLGFALGLAASFDLLGPAVEGLALAAGFGAIAWSALNRRITRT